MIREAINKPGVPTSQLPFSPAVKAGPFVFVSGQASVDDQGNIVSGTLEQEILRSFEYVRKVLHGAGLGLDHVVQVRAYLNKKEGWEVYNQVYREVFTAPLPARTTLMNCLEDEIQFEVDVIAYCGEPKQP